MKNFIKIFTSIDWSSISIGTYVRYIIMILTIINTILIRIGKAPIPIEEQQIYQTVSDFITIIVLIINTYKNNSTSTEAIKADAYLQNLKGNNVEYNSNVDEIEASIIISENEEDTIPEKSELVDEPEEEYEDVEDV